MPIGVEVRFIGPSRYGGRRCLQCACCCGNLVRDSAFGRCLVWAWCEVGLYGGRWRMLEETSRDKEGQGMKWTGTMGRYGAWLVVDAVLFVRPTVAGADQPSAVATLHSIGLYWSPDGGGADRHVLVRYREADATVWLQGLPMRYNPISGTDEDLADYRGSLVHLRPGATYEIELSLDDGSETVTVTAST